MHRINSTTAFLVPLILLAATAALSNGCGDSGSGLDNDASTNDNVDNDGDGYPASEDCDDNDDTVYPGQVRDCQSACDHGTETCLNSGTYSDCTAHTDCDCTTPGETRIIECGTRCGDASQECGLDLVWSYPEGCVNEGECSQGESDEQPCALCGSRIRLCGEDCTWLEWDDSGCSGSCAPGEQYYDICSTSEWLSTVYECDNSCEYAALEECTDACLLTPRVGNQDFKDEICVQAGPFIMGAPCAGTTGPEHTVNLSAYFIDKYAVTVGRYRECVQTGGCLAPTDPNSTYFDSNAEAKPITEVDWNHADVFCQWDGGRRLPTEAEWEKAAKGPAPRQVTYPWGDDEPICGLAPLYDCGQPMTTPWNVDDCPNGASYYGVEMIGTNVREWNSDWYDAGYYSTSPTEDPQGPSTGPWDKVLRGRIWSATNTITCPVSWRYFATIDTTHVDRGFRCARNAK